MIRILAKSALALTLVTGMGGCSSWGAGDLLGPEEPPRTLSEQRTAPERQWEAVAAADALGIIITELGGTDSSDDASPLVLAIDPTGGPASAALLDAVARRGYRTAVMCRTAETCIPAGLSVAPLGTNTLLARLDLEGVLQASWAYKIGAGGLSPAAGFTIGRIDPALMAQAIR